MNDKTPPCPECKCDVREHRAMANSEFKFCQACYELCLTVRMPPAEAAAKRRRQPTTK